VTPRTAAGALVVVVSLVAAVAAADWPQFRGPARDGMSSETGLYRSWPAGGPRSSGRQPSPTGTRAPPSGTASCTSTTTTWRKRRTSCARSPSPRARTSGSSPRQWTSVRITESPGPSRPSARSSSSPWIRNAGSSCSTRRRQGRVAEEPGPGIQGHHPGWYAGQNPLLDGDRVVLATGGDALAVAFDQATGKEVWRSPNPART